MKPIFLVGEAWGENEARLKRPLVGASGVELMRQLHDAEVIELSGADRNRIDLYYRTGDPNHLAKVWDRHPELYLTNVFNLRGPVEKFHGPKSEGIPYYNSIASGKYARAEFSPELDRLGDEVLSVDPNLIVCLGNVALWAFMGATGISKVRGTTIVSTHCVAGYKLLVTYNPAGVLHQPELRATCVADLSKIVEECKNPALVRPPCEIWIEPDLDDIQTFITRFIKTSPLVACDIETSGTQITCMGFAPRRDLAIVIPFHDPRKSRKSYWASAKLERQCWELVRSVLEDRAIAKVFQNGLYDIAFLLRSYGIRVFNAREDTMLLHHALQPEALKGLGYLGSLYTDHGPWKSERKHTDTIKRDE